MRELLFRGKCQTGEWVEGGFLDRKGKPEIIDFDRGEEGDFTFNTQVDSKTVGQFTGLTDMYGQKIFEGDIIQDGKDIVTVEWDEKFATWALLKRGWMYKHFFGEAIDSKDCEVIGNIHDNPELLP